MARNIIADLLQNHRFWLIDMVPSATIPFFVMGSPVYGFQSISMPEYTFEAREIKQMNSMMKRTVYEGGGWGTITLSRGVRVCDDTFYEWVRRAIEGLDTIDRHLLLIQYCPASFGGLSGDAATMGKIDGIISTVQAVAGTVVNPTGAWMGRMDSGYMDNVPGKLWVLWNCVPTRYKPGSDLDATDASVSIAELELAVHNVSEMTLLSAL